MGQWAKVLHWGPSSLKLWGPWLKCILEPSQCTTYKSLSPILKESREPKGISGEEAFWGGRGKVRDVPGEESVPLWRVFHHYITYHYFSVAFLYTVIFLLKPYLFLQSVCSPGCSSKDHEPHLSLGALELQCLVVPGDNQTCIVFVFLLSTIWWMSLGHI